MTKKFILTTLVIFYILFSNFATAIEIDSSNENLKETGISGLSSTIDLAYKEEDVNNPIIPNKEVREVNLTVTYNVTSSGKFLSKLFFLFVKDKQVNIKLSISYQPTWCEASLSQDTIGATVTDKEKTLSTKLIISLTENAPAYSLDKINIKLELPLGDTYKIAPYNKTIIPIKITNIGNGKTKIFTEIENASEKWDANLTDSIIIDIDNTDTINLVITTDNKYDQAEIKLKFTPAYADNIEEKGESQSIILLIENDGSYVEKESAAGIDLTAFIIALVIIVLIIGIIFTILQKKE